MVFKHSPSDNIKHDGKDLRFRIGRRDRIQYTCTASQYHRLLIYRLTVHNPSEGILTACADGSLTLWNAISRNKYGTFEKG